MIVWQEPPPHAEFVAEAQMLGRMAAYAGLCTRIGLIGESRALAVEVGNDFGRRADAAGAPRELLRSTILESTEIAAAEALALLNPPEDLSPSDRATFEKRSLQTLRDRCAWVTQLLPGAEIPSSQ